ncbi:hypothetical protein, partial [Nitratireductor aquibiodomus]|uniref:hypothetical protein n=1 Tax=Nitratireductor aquibiodomus TaxID=204799 RepID=UPI001AEBD551
ACPEVPGDGQTISAKTIAKRRSANLSAIPVVIPSRGLLSGHDIATVDVDCGTNHVRGVF